MVYLAYCSDPCEKAAVCVAAVIAPLAFMMLRNWLTNCLWRSAGLLRTSTMDPAALDILGMADVNQPPR